MDTFFVLQRNAYENPHVIEQGRTRSVFASNIENCLSLIVAQQRLAPFAAGRTVPRELLGNHP